MIDKFTDNAKKVLNVALHEVGKLNHNYIGTEHILMGLIKDGKGVAGKVLRNKHFSVAETRSMIVNLVGKGDEKVEIQGYTPRAKKLLELAYMESARYRKEKIDTQHLLLGMTKLKGSIGQIILEKKDLDYNKVYSEIKRIEKGQDKSVQVDENKEKGYIEEFGMDMVKKAKEDYYDPVIGREKEIKRIIQTLCRRTKNNPILIGEAGVGKTAIIEALAQKIVLGDVPEYLKNKKIVSLEMGVLVAGSKFRGEFEKRLTGILDEIKGSNDIILFIDEIHTITKAGGSEGAVDASNILKPSLSRGEIQVIGSTTFDEYKKYIEKDKSLLRRFQPVSVEEPDPTLSKLILQGIKEKYESFHNIDISEEAINGAVDLSVRYVNDRNLPDKAIDLLDEACSRKRLILNNGDEEVKVLEKKLAMVVENKREAVLRQNFENAAKLRDVEKEVLQELEDLKVKNKVRSDKDNEIGYDDIAMVISEWKGIPVNKLSHDDLLRLRGIEDRLESRVKGQIEAVKQLSRAIKKSFVGLRNKSRPIGTFLFLGPSGVGKTHLSNALGEFIFGSSDEIIRYDMSEFMEKHSISKLIGSPPGYVGYDEGGNLTERVKNKPYSIILFDEIEKAHPDILNILLQITDEGRLRDSFGRLIDFKNTIIIMTSNIGLDTIRDTKSMGFVSEGKSSTSDSDKKIILKELKKTLKVELLNRIDEIIVFKRLSKDDLKEIASMELENLRERLCEFEIDISFDKNIYENVILSDYEDETGARFIKRIIEREIEDLVVEGIISGEINQGNKIALVYDNGIVIIKENEVEEEED
ncbi:MAG: ATP-dependent Clp protease ATP-binding subunit [Firmicutes bacterium]|jgi:ATP-dependent Clp protease ATP-binding subunit ClpC|nr:ATP-dependent Clp protease ATP-binding subunit [Bacillota bacterium]